MSYYSLGTDGILLCLVEICEFGILTHTVDYVGSYSVIECALVHYFIFNFYVCENEKSLK